MGVPPVTKSIHPHLLYVDGLNYMKFFLGLETSSKESVDVSDLDLLSCLRSLEKTTAQFMQEAKQAGWKVSVYLDNCKQDPAEVEKWFKRAAQCMEAGGTTCILPATTLLLGNAFKKAGATVNYSLGYDCDETLAAHAHMDDAAVLSRDGDFLRFYGKKASGETYFLKKLFSNFTVGDARNGGSLALWKKRIPEDRYKKGWVLETGVGEVKGGRVPFLSHRPQVSPEYLLITERMQDCAIKRVSNISFFPFAFPCDAESDATTLLRCLRLAVYQLTREERVRETMLRWMDDRDGKVLEQQTILWTLSRQGWTKEEIKQEGQETSEDDVVDSWEELEGEEEEEEELSPTESAKLKLLLNTLSAPPPPTLPALSRVLDKVYEIVFGESDEEALPRTMSHPTSGEVIEVTDLQRKNEHSCRFLSMATYVGACWPRAVRDNMGELLLLFQAARADARQKPRNLGERGATVLGNRLEAATLS